MQYLSASEMATVDELAVNEFNIDILQMMEHARAKKGLDVAVLLDFGVLVGGGDAPVELHLDAL